MVFLREMATYTNSTKLHEYHDRERHCTSLLRDCMETLSTILVMHGNLSTIFTILHLRLIPCMERLTDSFRAWKAGRAWRLVDDIYNFTSEILLFIRAMLRLDSPG